MLEITYTQQTLRADCSSFYIYADHAKNVVDGFSFSLYTSDARHCIVWKISSRDLGISLIKHPRSSRKSINETAPNSNSSRKDWLQDCGSNARIRWL